MVLMAVCAFFLYAEYEGGKRIPPEVQRDPNYILGVEEAVADARSVRFLEFIAAVFFFAVVGVVMAHYRFPRLSWVRNLLAAFTAFLLTFVIFAMKMEGVFRSKMPASSMPFSALETAIVWAAFGVIGAIVFCFILERLHVWRVDRP
jgi:hypothetical protein